MGAEEALNRSAFSARKDAYIVSDDPSLLDHPAIYDYLSRSYWAKTRQRHTQDIANRNSHCFGLYCGAAQVGFARVVTDYATFAYLADVYVLEAHQGKKLGKWLVECVQNHPRLQGLRRWALATRNAHGLYSQLGWTPLAHTERWMERFDPDGNPPSDGG